MKAKELVEELLKNPDFEVRFVFLDMDNTDYGCDLRSFSDLDITDIGYSDKVIILGEK